MITMPVLQFVFLLIALVALTIWFAAKVFLLVCVENETTLGRVLLLVWQKNPDNLQRAMNKLLTQEEADDMLKSTQSYIDKTNKTRLESILKDADFTDGDCRHCGQPVPWSARSSELPPP